MHCEKNISQSLLGFIFGEKDTISIWRDMEEVVEPDILGGERDPRKQHTPELHLWPIGTSGVFFKPHAPYDLTPNARGQFLNLVSSIKTPTDYTAQLGKHVG